MTLEDLEGRLDTLARTVDTLSLRLTATGTGRCSPAYPHPEGLSFMRGINQYICQCGQIYQKDGQGALREVA